MRSVTVEDTFNINDIDKAEKRFGELLEECDCDPYEWNEVMDGSNLIHLNAISNFEHKLENRWCFRVPRKQKYCNRIERYGGKEEIITDPLKIKHYIKQRGEECSICLDEITSRKNSILTACGHSFHKSCLCNYYFKNYSKFDECPICRSSTACWDHVSFDALDYNSNGFNASSWNGINKLIMRKHGMIPQMCGGQMWDDWHGKPHVMGTNKTNCIQCRRYISTGKPSLKLNQFR